MAEGDKEIIIPINIEDEMRGAYIDYSMSVIISRALPDVRDGLKPVHRRVLYGMLDLGVNWNKPYKKSARIVGEVLGKYHPHGDSSVYDTMVRMAQEWSLRYPLVDGQGNFGSIDGDSPAAMRYTEARLRRIADEMLTDINKDTVDFQLNFDDSLKEPTVLPGKLPNLLLNGSSGIAVGMATNMAPHNLTEVADGITAYIDNNDITIEELMEHVKAPDFPTGGIIYGFNGVKSAFETGRGRIVMRAKAEIEPTSTGRERIIVTEIPYQVNKASMIEKTAALVNEKKIEGISDIRDESDRNGLRIVYELKKDAIGNVVLNNLFKYTQLQSSFGVNNVALVKGRPHTLNLKEIIQYYVEHRHDVVTRRTQYELNEAEKRAHILEGYLIALDNLDEIIDLIRSSRDPEVAKTGLMEKFELTEIQAKAILEMRLQRLTGMEREKIQKEYDELMELIAHLKEILEKVELRMAIIKDELIEVRDRYGDERRTEIVYAADDLTSEDMIPNDEMLITVSHQGYMKRTQLSEYRTQGRGGVGSRGASSKEDDFTEYLFACKNHDYMLIFTEFGKVFWKKVWQVPEGSKTSKGRPIQNLINIEPGDKIRAIINVDDLKDEDYINNNFLIMCTENGTIKKTALEAYSRPRTNGINAITIHEGDRLLDIRLTNGDNHIIIGKRSGKVVHFHESDVRSMGRTAAGVRGVTLEGDDDRVVGMVCVAREDANLLVVSEKGYGKRSPIEDYRITKRGGKGVKTINITEKTGNLVAIKEVIDTDDLMIINKSGITIRLSVDGLRVMGRATQGVKLIRLNDNDQISSVEKIEKVEGEEEEVENQEGATTNENEAPTEEN
ncbi:DNA gyrase subunit A [Roseivirga pacifica]|uniref:DNA gyrase subunit A n=1 Tax=Roseivirga pacifica TaxID=1267423 RepID=UPI0020950056|nr:DNA gyrase subunit A [Roseivirga pacifica]MCO6360637.1 DNA gyrase subunit A [Roseivirga pacifica]MCO6368526.1 DNA gyrase subunit A [Roseivirga pacifica]MCO6372668.1 DNA gyrase subunit A [Roseivirga pacifica]MCO6376726.1 DNA gyrase subunit A [Roseivirga pacifica]MCO6377994.1 DNA gyrase subunit A [Roseivirga pacifica]